MTCPLCDRPLGFSTREGWFCVQHGADPKPEREEVEYPEDTATPSMFPEVQP